MRIDRCGITAIAVAMVALASAAGAQQVTGSGIRVSKEPVIPAAGAAGANVTAAPTTMQPATPPITSFSPGDVELYNSMTDRNITAHMIAGDSLEIEIARLATLRGSSFSVRDYATMLVTDHTAHLNETRHMAVDEDIGVEAHPSDMTAMHLTAVLNELRNAPAGADFDRTFLRHQAMHHTHDIAALRALKPVARDDDLEEWIDETLPTLERHLARAQAIATELGITLDPPMSHQGMMHNPPPSTAPTTPPPATYPPPAANPPASNPPVIPPPAR